MKMKKFEMDSAIIEAIENRQDFIRLEQEFGPHTLIAVLKGRDAWEHVERHLRDSDYLCGVNLDGEYYLNHVGQYLVQIPAEVSNTAELVPCLLAQGIEVVEGR